MRHEEWKRTHLKGILIHSFRVFYITKVLFLGPKYNRHQSIIYLLMCIGVKLGLSHQRAECIHNEDAKSK
jgi:hypothetical protein